MAFGAAGGLFVGAEFTPKPGCHQIRCDGPGNHQYKRVRPPISASELPKTANFTFSSSFFPFLSLFSAHSARFCQARGSAVRYTIAAEEGACLVMDSPTPAGTTSSTQKLAQRLCLCAI